MMSQEVNSRDNVEGVSSTSKIIEIPEIKTTDTSTNENENLNDNNAKVGKSNQELMVNSPPKDRDIEVANEKSNQGLENHIRVPLSKARLTLVFIGYII